MNKMDSFQVSLTSKRFEIIDWRKGKKSIFLVNERKETPWGQKMKRMA
jgi:hypothetical protein